MSAYTIGSIPPADSPITKHMNRFHANDGMKPQIEVPRKNIAARRIDGASPQTVGKNLPR